MTRSCLLLTLLGLLGCIDPEPPADLRDWDLDGYPAEEDCDDLDPSVFPGAPERCDGVDEDCDGVVDQSSGAEWYQDQDGDGWGDGDPVTSCFRDEAMANRGQDCDDTDAAVFPGASERCDGRDEDCDGLVDEAPTDGLQVWRDTDGDGYGDPDVETTTCALSAGLVENGEDCHDSDPDINPEGQERCDEHDLDEDCDGLVDDADHDAIGQGTIYRDRDGDGDGASAESIPACDAQEGYAAQGDDCDDDDRSVGAPEALWPDQDEDGYGQNGVTVLACPGDSQVAEAGGDCDDADPSQNPGATETWYDGEDQDCDGSNDYDADGDGAVEALYGGDDCDDRNSDTHPDQAEVWYDGVDRDCDGASDYDADQDGHDSETFGGKDCNDAASYWSPDATTPGYPGDWNCDGADDLDAQTWTSADSTYQWYGSALAGVGDTNGDGLDDVLVGAPGSSSTSDGDVILMAGAPAAEGLDASAGSLSWTRLERLGVSVAGAGDLDGDGYDDLLSGGDRSRSGASKNGFALLWLAPLTGEQSAEDADVTVAGEASLANLGSALDMRDLDGDGADELVTSAPGAESGRDALAGAVYTYTLADGEATLATTVQGTTAYGYLGTALDASGDLDGDGQADLLLGEPRPTTGPGLGWVVYGPIEGDLVIEDVGLSITGLNTKDYTGAALDGGADVNGDGYDDLLLGSAGRDATSLESAGAAWLFLGPLRERVDADAYDARFLGDAPGLRLGAALAFVGDVDGDDVDDLAIGAPGAAGSSAGEGEVWVYCGAQSGSLAHADACAFLRGTDNGVALGSAVAGAGDVDGDGYADIVAGGPLGTDGQITLLRGGF